MSEKIRTTKESGEPESLGEHSERIARHHEHQAKSAEKRQKQDIDKIIDKIETISSSKQEVKIASSSEGHKDKDSNKHFVGKELKTNSLKQTLRKVRKDLKPYQRPFSRIVHNKTVEKISETSAKTVARPSGLLIGGLSAFMMSLIVLAFCKYYGYEYNYLIGLLSFPVGFFIGIVGEGVVKTLKRS